MAGSDRYRLKILIIAAGKKVITHKWLQADPQSVECWLKIVSEIFEMEKLTVVQDLKRIGGKMD